MRVIFNLSTRVAVLWAFEIIQPLIYTDHH